MTRSLIKAVGVTIPPGTPSARSLVAAILGALLVLAVFPDAEAFANVSGSFDGRLVCNWNVPVTPPEGGHLNWYELKADPENPSSLIVCGAVRDAQANAYVGVVYSSQDGGRSWRTALEDRASTWVSEQSCAFGAGHIVYFISEASKVINGLPHHSLGTTHIYVSHDAGVTWVKTAETDWADYSSSAVTRSSATGEQLYVSYNSGKEYDPHQHLGSALGFFVVSQDGQMVSPHRVVPGMAELNYQGVYPSSSVTLKDGSIVTLYSAGTKRATGKGTIALEIGAVRFTAEGASRPVIVADPVYRYEPPVPVPVHYPTRWPMTGARKCFT